MFYPKNIAFGRERKAVPAPTNTSYPWNEWWNGSLIGSGSYGPYRTETSGRLMGDYVTPNFKKEVATGTIVLNNNVYEQGVSKWQPIKFDISANINGNTGRYVAIQSKGLPLGGAKSFYSSATALWDSLEDAMGYVGLRDAAIVKSWSKVDQSAMAALATLGELPETIRWIKSILERLINIMRLLRGKPLRKIGKKDLFSLKELSNVPFDAWLEWRYAIRPLIFEMNNALKALSTIIEKGTRQTARGYTYDIAASSVSSTITGPGVYVKHGFVTTEKHSVEFRGGVLYNLSEVLDDLVSVWGFDQPIEAVWELIPFSFIIDWFFNIGDIISGLSTGVGLSPLGSWVTMNYNVRTTMKGNSYTPYWDGWPISSFVLLQEPSYSLEHVLKQRWINPSKLVLPSFKMKLDPQKILDLVAIGRQLLKAKR